MKLNDDHKQYLLKEQIINAFVLNFIINGFISWLSLKNAETITYWKEAKVGVDLLLTGILLPIFMCMINSRLIAAQVQKGKIPIIPLENIPAKGWHRRKIFHRSLFLAVLSTLIISLPTVLILQKLMPEPISIWSFVIFKALWAAILAVLVSPQIAVWAIEEASDYEHNQTDQPF